MTIYLVWGKICLECSNEDFIGAFGSRASAEACVDYVKSQSCKQARIEEALLGA